MKKCGEIFQNTDTLEDWSFHNKITKYYHNEYIKINHFNQITYNDIFIDMLLDDIQTWIRMLIRAILSFKDKMVIVSKKTHIEPYLINCDWDVEIINGKRIYHIKRKPFHEPAKKKLAIITAIFGESDDLKEQIFKDNDKVDFYCFTDNENITSEQWKIITEPYHLKDIDYGGYNSYSKIKKENHLQRNIMSGKYYKMNSHRIDILKDYEYVLWQDASIEVKDNDFLSKIYNIIEGKEFVIYDHPTRSRIYDEGYASTRYSKYDTQKLKEQIIYYRNNGFKDDYNVYSTGFFIKKHNPFINFLFDIWWFENQMRSYQCQMGLSYVLWLFEKTPDYVFKEHIYRNDFIRVNKHTKKY